ncbi:hypothetical protein LC613_36560 [Nostoc sphaeroides CHAB 2801]|uniref:hypothetical protein n=1 Tax=Nostoc sphaeroides TaxID=446679 RepID=UPI001E478956|nr:hypothetical protein [Nostoc sphaeroides]MCC5633038.1 hypothetical protein [Nostoc sphaeroides CHAB 2801]
MPSSIAYACTRLLIGAMPECDIALILERLKFFTTSFQTWFGHRDLPGGSSVRRLLPANPVLAPATFPGGTSVLVRQCSLN